MRSYETVAVWGHAWYSPVGRLSDWFRRAADLPAPRTMPGYRLREIEALRLYIGNMPASAERRVFRYANGAVWGYDACRTSAQARLRDRVLLRYLTDMIADIPTMGPAE